MSIRPFLVCLIMLQLVALSRGFRISRVGLANRRQMWRALGTNFRVAQDQKDCLLTGLNGDQDISVKVLSCKDILQEMMRRNDLSPVAAKNLGDLVACSLMMAAGYKGEETLQLNFVGNTGIKNIIAIADGNLSVRGSVGNPQFAPGVNPKDVHINDLLGEGQVQVVRNHPAWKHPMNGITELRPYSIATNMALYMAESEQRRSALLTDVKIEGDTVVSALGLMVESLPGASTENIETSVANMEAVQKKGLQNYVTEFFDAQKAALANTDTDTTTDTETDTTDTNTDSISGTTTNNTSISTLTGKALSEEERYRAEDLFASLDSPLDKILDDCMVLMDKGSIRWDKKPTFKCSCDVSKVWRALKLLGQSEIEDIVNKKEDINVSTS